jgi:hypothetical protein
MCWFSLNWRLGALRKQVFRPSGEGFQGIKVCRSDEVLEAAQGTGSSAAIHRFDEPTRLSLGMVASPQSPLPDLLRISEKGIIGPDRQPTCRSHR